MRIGLDVAPAAALIGDPARGHMLAALISGQALTAGELAREAGVSLPTASFHIAKLEAGGLVTVRKQGRHRYIALSGPEIGAALEALMVVAAAAGDRRTWPGPRDPALRAARVCYDHLAGEVGVTLLDRMTSQAWVELQGSGVGLTDAGRARLRVLGVHETRATPAACRLCMDWSERRPHLGGAVGRLILTAILERGWARRDGRILSFGPAGRAAFERWSAAGVG